MLNKLAIIVVVLLMLTGCGTMKFAHGKIYYRTDLMPNVPVTTDRHPKDRTAIVVTRDSAMLQYRKEF